MNQKPNIKDWIGAFRLRTLPLAFSCILTGSAIAAIDNNISYSVLTLALITTLFLQILSNLANDYGDAEKGTDNENRVGPERAIQSGKISKKQMKKAMIIFVVLSLFAGIPLVIIGTREINPIWLFTFLGLGILSIIAAIKYTAGKGAYGYRGLGDVFVFLFFGIVGVCGVYFLHTNSFEFVNLLPASTIGLFASAVLNLNNMRDIENDKAMNKNTLAVKLGLKNAKVYHLIILLFGISAYLFFYLYKDLDLVFLTPTLSFIPIIIHLVKSLEINNPVDFDPELKKIALSTFLFSLLLWIGIIV